MFTTQWDQLPEVEVLPNNYRRSVSGLELGVNSIRWEHPSGTTPHTHPDAEQAILVVDGSMEWLIGGEVVQLEAGSVAVVPRGVEHCGHTTGASARFYEVFAPARIENLVGFLGRSLLPPDLSAGSATEVSTAEA